MASMYASLRGKIPVQEKTARSQGVSDAIKKRRTLTLNALTLEYNQNTVAATKIASEATALKAVQDAIEILVREKIDGEEMDSAKLNGYAWTPTCEPYPVADDVDAVMQYFRDNGMEDKLRLSPTEIASRLKAHVKEESLANEFVIVEKKVLEDGVEKTVQEVRSKIPGVRIFLKEDLSRQKSK